MAKTERRKKQLKRAIRRARKAGQPVDPKLIAELKAYEENLSKTGMASFKTSQMGNKGNLDSDSDASSGDDPGKFDRDEFTPEKATATADQVKIASEAVDIMQNADLAADMGHEGEMIGVIIPPPDNLGST